MAELGIEIDLSEISEKSDFELLQPGMQQVAILHTEMCDNRQGTGQYLKVEFEVTSGPYAGRKLWDNLSIIHENNRAQNIARQQFRQLCLACGIEDEVVSETSGLHGVEINVLVDIEPGSGGYKDKNIITQYHASAEVADGQEDKPFEKPAAKVSLEDDELPF